MAVGLIATIILRLRNIAKHHQTLAGWNETRSFVLRFSRNELIYRANYELFPFNSRYA